jgi:hypothetical protein
MPALEFTEADLRANQQGELGETQRQHLTRLRQRALMVGATVFFGLVFLATLLLFFGQANANGILTLLGILLTMLNAVAMGMFARQWMRLNSDIQSAQVEAVTGTLERIVKPQGRVSNYVLRLEGRDFAVKKEAFKLFRHEVRYTFYCAPKSGSLLAAEPHH